MTQKHTDQHHCDIFSFFSFYELDCLFCISSSVLLSFHLSIMQHKLDLISNVSAELKGSLTTVVLVTSVRTLLDAITVSCGREAGVVGADEAVTPSSPWRHTEVKGH